MDGQMIEAKEKLVVMESPRAAETPTQATGRGIAILCEAANMVLEDSGLDIAMALGKSSIGGHIQAVRFLFDLAKLQQELGQTEKAQRMRSLASEWAAEPEWNGEKSTDSAEAASGGSAPEN